MDPLSITVGALSLAKICGTVGIELGLFVHEAGNIGTVVASLQADVKDFETVLGLLHDTVNDADVKQWLSSNGRVEPYWESLAVSLEDAKRTLQALNETVVRINKSTGVLETVRKHMRLKFANEELNMYQQRIMRFKDTVNIILHTTTIWHQVSDKTIPEQVVPRLDETQDMIRRLGLQFNERMASLQTLIQSQTLASPSEAAQIPEKEEFKTLEHLRDCLKGAASVMTSASTIVGRRVQDGSSTVYGSDFGDVFPSDPSDSTLNWIRENAIQESDEGYVTTSEVSRGNHHPQRGKLPELPEEPDYDEELELEVMQAYYKQGLQHWKQKELEEAERCFRNCIDAREDEATPRVQSQQYIALTLDAMEELVAVLYRQKKWNELQILLKRKLLLQSRLSTPNQDVELNDKLLLAEALYYFKDYKEALLYCRSAEVGYRNRGSEGVTDRIDALGLLRDIYLATDRVKDAEGCKILVTRLKKSQRQTLTTPTINQMDKPAASKVERLESAKSSRLVESNHTITSQSSTSNNNNNGNKNLSEGQRPINLGLAPEVLDPRLQQRPPAYIAPPPKRGESMDKVRAFSSALFKALKGA